MRLSYEPCHGKRPPGYFVEIKFVLQLWLRRGPSRKPSFAYSVCQPWRSRILGSARSDEMKIYLVPARQEKWLNCRIFKDV
jgi:hypothetical protein